MNPPPMKQQPAQHLITVMSPETEWLESQYGNTTFRDWCDYEIARFRKLGRKVRLIQDKAGRCGIVSN